MSSDAFSLLLFAGDVAEAFFQGADFAEPLHAVGFVEALVGVGLDLQQSRDLGEVEAEHGAADAGVFVVAGGAVGAVAGAVAGAEGDLAEVEVVAELGPFGVGGFAVLVEGRRERPWSTKVR